VITVSGSVYSHEDGATIDAAYTTWADGAPGGGSIDAGGLVDFAAGGFELVAADPSSHVVKAVATGGAAPACAIAQVSAPCLPLRLDRLAHSRLMPVAEWRASLRGELRVEAPLAASSAAEPWPAAAHGSALAFVARTLGLVLGVLALLALCCSLYRRWRRWAGSARRRFARLAHGVAHAAEQADPVLGKVLNPALRTAVQAVRDRRIDPLSAQGRRLEHAFEQLHLGLRAEAKRKQLEAERSAADGVAFEVEVAIETAAELSQP